MYLLRVRVVSLQSEWLVGLLKRPRSLRERFYDK
jgi:hypothetical protein